MRQQILVSVSLLLLVIGLALFGCGPTTAPVAPAPLTPTPTEGQISVQGISPGAGSNLPYLVCTSGGDCVKGYFGARVILCQNGGTTCGFEASGATGTISATVVNITSTLKINGSQFSGAVWSQTIPNYVDGQVITHSFAITPTCNTSALGGTRSVLTATPKYVGPVTMTANMPVTSTLYVICQGHGQ